ncbi:MAG: hypothetical protein U0903_16655 [Planctomycetales bacterium]
MTSKASRSKSLRSVNFWQEENGEKVWVLSGDCRLMQGKQMHRAAEMVVWQVRPPGNSRSPREKVILYLRNESSQDDAADPMRDDARLVELWTTARITSPSAGGQQRITREDPLYQQALQFRQQHETPLVRLTGHTEVEEVDDGIQMLPPPLAEPKKSGVRRVRIFPRSSTPNNFYSKENPKATPPEQIAMITDGLQVIVDDLEGLGDITLLADRAVIWIQTPDGQGLGSMTEMTTDQPMQFYLEGNIVIRQGDKTLRANRAFYDLQEDRAILLDAELKVTVPNLPMPLRVRGEEIRQLSKGSFQADNAWVSTSRFGKPGFRVQSSQIKVEERSPTSVFGNKSTEVDPETGAPVVQGDPWVTSTNNSLWIEDMPVGYFPYITAPMSKNRGSFPQVSVGNDRVFGVQVRTVSNLLQLAKIDAPPGTELNLMADYLSKRGPAIGLNGKYDAPEGLFGIPAHMHGDAVRYFIYDTGLDNLGLDRRTLVPPYDARGRATFHNWMEFDDDTKLYSEIGYFSDRNFQEQYFEKEFDTAKDNETLLQFKKDFWDNQSFSILGKYRLNDPDTTASWLPKLDHYMLGEPLLNNWVTLSSHSSAGYAHLQPGAYPTDPNDLYVPLPYTPDVEGAVLSTRQEITMPFQNELFNIAPYALGGADYWSQDMTGNELGRLYGSAGVRGSMMMWRAFPEVNSEILGLRGLAHKMIFDFDYSYSQATTPLYNVPQYNEFDDLAQYRFRNRLIVNTFGGTLPPQFEPRYYAVRTGAAHNVTAPYSEMVDDQQVLRLGWRHRLQTKVGPFENPRIKDWMTLDLEASFFPDSMRDNFGKDWGLLSGRYNWYVSDRTTVLANAYYDTFQNAQQLWNFGVISQRSTRGSVYVGLRQVKGATLDSQILTTSYSYQMTDKWVSTFGNAYDLGEHMNRGQSMTLTRVGNDFLIHIGANYDASKNNVGFAIAVEPRFFNLGGNTQGSQSSTQLGSLLNGF